MDTRSLLLAALLGAAASSAPLTAQAAAHGSKTPPRADHGPGAESPDARDRCARTRAYPTWCRERDARAAEQERERERERVRRREGSR